ncbi:MAG: hypothetical protein SPH79_05220 [Schaalia hyovaginalis]|uniref:hypothetical protein n=1 Tax=Schaalia hyovaginalis TaxID=29316 RepID=UPI002A9112A7|nr:hypothetical protein [Schaalia hyovaginalis]MDY6213868.1 hypothetical protein [Schaalia hyovaginalis]
MMRRWAQEGGEATVEFVGLVFLLVVPVVYLVVSLAQVQGALFAAEAGAREASRILAEDPGDEARALAQIDLAFDDFHVASSPRASFGCRVCSGADRDVEVEVSALVPLPFVPRWAQTRLAIPVKARSATLVEGVRLDE